MVINRYARASVRYSGRASLHSDENGPVLRDSRGAVRERQPPLHRLHAAPRYMGHVPGHTEQARPHTDRQRTTQSQNFIVTNLTMNSQTEVISHISLRNPSCQLNCWIHFIYFIILSLI